MSAPHQGFSVAVAGERTRFKSGYDPRRSAGGVSAAEKAFRQLVETKHIPKADRLLDKVFDMGMDGDPKMAELFFKVCALIKKPTDADKIQQQAKALLDAMMAEARERRQAGAPAPAAESTAIAVREPVDRGTDE